MPLYDLNVIPNDNCEDTILRAIQCMLIEMLYQQFF